MKKKIFYFLGLMISISIFAFTIWMCEKPKLGIEISITPKSVTLQTEGMSEEISIYNESETDVAKNVRFESPPSVIDIDDKNCIEIKPLQSCKIKITAKTEILDNTIFKIRGDNTHYADLTLSIIYLNSALISVDLENIDPSHNLFLDQNTQNIIKIYNQNKNVPANSITVQIPSELREKGVTESVNSKCASLLYGEVCEITLNTSDKITDKTLIKISGDNTNVIDIYVSVQKKEISFSEDKITMTVGDGSKEITVTSLSELPTQVNVTVDGQKCITIEDTKNECNNTELNVTNKTCRFSLNINSDSIQCLSPFIYPIIVNINNNPNPITKNVLVDLGKLPMSLTYPQETLVKDQEYRVILKNTSNNYEFKIHIKADSESGDVCSQYKTVDSLDSFSSEIVYDAINLNEEKTFIIKTNGECDRSITKIYSERDPRIFLKVDKFAIASNDLDVTANETCVDGNNSLDCTLTVKNKGKNIIPNLEIKISNDWKECIKNFDTQSKNIPLGEQSIAYRYSLSSATCDPLKPVLGFYSENIKMRELSGNELKIQWNITLDQEMVINQIKYDPNNRSDINCNSNISWTVQNTKHIPVNFNVSIPKDETPYRIKDCFPGTCGGGHGDYINSCGYAARILTTLTMCEHLNSKNNYFIFDSKNDESVRNTCVIILGFRCAEMKSSQYRCDMFDTIDKEHSCPDETHYCKATIKPSVQCPNCVSVDKNVYILNYE